MLEELTFRGRIIAAAMRLAAAKSWERIPLLEIAEEAGASLLEVKDLFASKSDVIVGFVRAIDDEMLRRAPPRTAGATDPGAAFRRTAS